MAKGQPSTRINDDQVEDYDCKHGLVCRVVPRRIGWLVDVRSDDGRKLDGHVV